MAPLTDKPRVGCYIVSEAGGATGGMRSRESVTYQTGAVYEPGMVLGVVSATGKFGLYDKDATDGTEAPAGICFGHYDASAADVIGVATVRESEVNAAELIWPAGYTDAEIATALAALKDAGIVAR